MRTAQREFFSKQSPEDGVVYPVGRGPGSKTKPITIEVPKITRGYVVGLMFDRSLERIVLIRKEHGPKCVVGKWNGPGGKIEHGETSNEAMAREFHEETGVATLAGHWNQFCTIRGEGFFVDFFWNTIPSLNEAKTKTDEEVKIFRSYFLPLDIMENLRWMIALIMDETIDRRFNMHNGSILQLAFKGTDAE